MLSRVQEYELECARYYSVTSSAYLYLAQCEIPADDDPFASITLLVLTPRVPPDISITYLRL